MKLHPKILAMAGSVLVAGLPLASHQSFAQQLDASAPSVEPVPGFASVDIGGRSLRYKCAGQGSPTVIVEPGLGISLETVFSWDRKMGWALIFPKIQKATRICVYDRAGLGRSDKAPVPRTSSDVANDLHALLTKANIPPPYVFAGQSFGGMNARMFANKYPQSVAGMVLISSTHPDQWPRWAQAFPPPPPAAHEHPIMRDLREGGPDFSKTAEWIDLRANANLVRATSSLGDIPLIVLSPDPNWNDPAIPDELQNVFRPITQELEADLAKLSTHGKQVVAKKAGHNIQLDEPQLVIDAILDVVKQVRRRQG
jgi:pimeloyl-ACP methyl ester carboxylesterase